MTAYLAELNARVERAEARRAEELKAKQAAASTSARDRLTPLEVRLARLLATIPAEVQAEGLSLPQLQTALRGRWRGSCHPGELGDALRRVGFNRERRWRGDGGSFSTLWYPGGR